jgi:regulator of PEP synthase PpsR (kinase-PPPase family)
MTQETAPKVLVLSDGTGETASGLIEAAALQFPSREVQLVRHKNIRSDSQIEAILASITEPASETALHEAEHERTLIVYTLVSPALRTYLLKRSHELGLTCVDLMGPLLKGLGHILGDEPQSSPGLLHEMNDRYFRRVAAMEFTIQHDDGRELSGLEQADLVIVGVSRTSKTPLSIYLSMQGWRVVNVPIILGFSLPEEIYQIDPRRVVGLTIDPEILSHIRKNRVSRVSRENGGDYADPRRVLEEIEYANEVFRKNRKWAIFNVTSKALEETASEIVKLMAARRLTPPHSLENTAST